jgi:threonine synthase
MLNHVIGFRCVVCQKRYRLDEVAYVCPDHGNEGILDVSYDYDAIAADAPRLSFAGSGDRTMWRYRAILPIGPDAPIPPLSVGGTPLYETALAAEVGVGRLWLKDETRQPTASLKDRASAMALVKAAEVGAEVVTTASTGNAAAALAGIAASTGQATVIFVPQAAPEAKVAQLLAYGATVVLVAGNYGAAFDLCMEAATANGWYNRNTGFNPFMTEGKKTVALEILEQVGWSAPDVVAVSVGDGSIIGGVHKGLKDALALGWIDRMPRILGVQSAGSDYLVQAWESGEDVLKKAPIAADTVADSISADLPRDRIKALAAITETEGAYVRVDDAEILAAIPEIAAATGVFAEPAGAAGYPGIRHAVERGLIGANEDVVLIVTGSGLKDVGAAMKGAAAVGRTPLRVPPELSALNRALATSGAMNRGAS